MYTNRELLIGFCDIHMLGFIMFVLLHLAMNLGIVLSKLLKVF